VVELLGRCGPLLSRRHGRWYGHAKSSHPALAIASIDKRIHSVWRSVLRPGEGDAPQQAVVVFPSPHPPTIWPCRGTRWRTKTQSSDV